MWSGTATLEKITRQFLKTSNIQLPYDPAIALLGIYPKEIKTYVCKCLYMNIHRNFSHWNSKLETVRGFPGGSVGKESVCNVGDLGSIPGLGRSPGGGHGNLLQYSCLENSHEQRSLAGCSPLGHRVGHDWAIKHSTAQHGQQSKCPSTGDWLNCGTYTPIPQKLSNNKEWSTDTQNNPDESWEDYADCGGRLSQNLDSAR